MRNQYYYRPSPEVSRSRRPQPYVLERFDCPTRRLMQRSLTPVLPRNLWSNSWREAEPRTLSCDAYARVLSHRFADTLLACPERSRALTKLRHTLCARRPESQEVSTRKEYVSGMRGIQQRISERRWRIRGREKMYCQRQYDEQRMTERPERIVPLMSARKNTLSQQ